MECLEIIGGCPLHGSVRVQGSKNAALPILAASVLHRGVTVLHNCPKILDVIYMTEILRELGCGIEWEGHTLTIDAGELTSNRVSPLLGEKMRSSIILMGSLTGRMGEAQIPFPGGCSIGARPIDLHIEGLKALGIKVEERDGMLHSKAEYIRGGEVALKFPSVGATENLILAGVLAKGKTTIYGAAREPEIQELCAFLNAKGARIRGAGSSQIRILGVQRLEDSQHDLMPDRIVAGTYLMAAVATRGSILLEKAPWDQMGAVLEAAEKMGASWEVTDHGLKIEAEHANKPIPRLITEVYPGFPTDLQSQAIAVLSMARGESVISEQVFESRYRAAGQLNRMGAWITIDGREAWIRGERRLRGSRVVVPDLRGGAALVIAGLCANGRTVVEDEGYIRRGYEDISADLRKLGGNIRIVEQEQ